MDFWVGLVLFIKSILIHESDKNVYQKLFKLGFDSYRMISLGNKLNFYFSWLSEKFYLI